MLFRDFLISHCSQARLVVKYRDAISCCVISIIFHSLCNLFDLVFFSYGERNETTKSRSRPYYALRARVSAETTSQEICDNWAIVRDELEITAPFLSLRCYLRKFLMQRMSALFVCRRIEIISWLEPVFKHELLEKWMLIKYTKWTFHRRTSLNRVEAHSGHFFWHESPNFFPQNPRLSFDSRTESSWHYFFIEERHFNDSSSGRFS